MGERRRDAVDMLVGRNIRILRQDRGMSQTELGISSVFVFLHLLEGHVDLPA